MSEPNQNFSSKNLGWMRRWHSQAHLRARQGNRPNSPEEWNDFLSMIEQSIAKDEFLFQGLRWHNIRGKRALSSVFLEDVIVIRKINDNLRRAYNLRQPNRTSLIRTAKQALRESTPKTVLRIDLRQCFESMCRNSLLREIKKEARVSTQTTALLDSLFSDAKRKSGGRMTHGIPRGLTVSTSLAEIKLQELDKRLRVIPGTYLYLRYVDDILIFSTASESQAMHAACSEIMKSSFKLNDKKSMSIRVGCSCEDACHHTGGCPCSEKCDCLSINNKDVELEYLGYKLLFSKRNKKKDDSFNSVYCVLSDRKTQRIKTRIVRSISDCAKYHDWKLLEDRIKYIVSNQKIASSPMKRGLFNGLSYTHEEYDPPPGFKGNGTLSGLDAFYRSQLRRFTSQLAVKPVNLKSLESITFSSGFLHRRRTKFSGNRVIQIQKCWGT